MNQNIRHDTMSLMLAFYICWNDFNIYKRWMRMLFCRILCRHLIQDTFLVCPSQIQETHNTTRVNLVRGDNGEFQMKHLLDWKQPREPACLAQMIINTPAVCPAPNKPRVTKHILSWAISFNNSPVTIHLIWLPISANVIIAGRGASVTVDSIKL